MLQSILIMINKGLQHYSFMEEKVVNDKDHKKTWDKKKRVKNPWQKKKRKNCKEHGFDWIEFVVVLLPLAWYLYLFS